MTDPRIYLECQSRLTGFAAMSPTVHDGGSQKLGHVW